MKLVIKELPKFSLNTWYSGNHWSKRARLKNIYTLIINNQIKGVLPKYYQYNTTYTFFFKSNPLDASNCVAMAKMIEDIIFENDKYDIILSVTLKSRKSNNNFVEIEINKL